MEEEGQQQSSFVTTVVEGACGRQTVVAAFPSSGHCFMKRTAIFLLHVLSLPHLAVGADSLNTRHHARPVRALT